MKPSFERGPKKNKEKVSFLERIRESLLPELEKTSLSLRKKGFFVDGDCRINLEELKGKGLYSDSVIDKDIKRSLKKKDFFEKERKGISRQEKKENLYRNEVGEIAEQLKTISFNKFWFRERFIALRTSLYDDIFNGIDELILDPNPKKPRVVAALDTTSLKNAWQEKAGKIIEKIKKPEKIKIDYGAVAKRIRENKFEIKYKKLQAIPLFILAFKENEEEISKWQRAIKDKDEDFLFSLLKEQISKLKDQAKIFSQISHPSLKKEYLSLYQFFEREERNL